MQASVRLGGTTAGLNTSWELNEGQVEDKDHRDKGFGKRGDVLISLLDDVLMVDVSCVLPAGHMARKKASEQEVQQRRRGTRGRGRIMHMMAHRATRSCHSVASPTGE